MNEIEKRVSRILGQLRGISKMVKEDRDCQDILQQISAVKKAIDGLTLEILFKEISDKTLPESRENVKKIIDKAIQL